MITAQTVYLSDYANTDAAIAAARRQLERLTVGAPDEAFPIRVDVATDTGKRLAIVSSDPDED